MNEPVTITIRNLERINHIHDEFEQDMDESMRELYVDPQRKMERYEAYQPGGSDEYLDRLQLREARVSSGAEAAVCSLSNSGRRTKFHC